MTSKAGLFSATVTAFIIESYKTLQPDTSNAAVDLLYQITQQMAFTANGTQFPPSVLLPPPGQTQFSPGFTAIATNVLWFISLGLSLACAVAATLVQQWARNYIHAIERRPSAERRARMRMYLFEGVERFKMSHVVDGVPALLHLALFSFLLGLIFFIQPISTPLTAVSIVVLVVCVAVYLFATFLPLFALDSPIQTPLTSVICQKVIIRILYKTCVHSLLVVAALNLAGRYVLRPIKAMWVSLDAPWTIFDLFFRQMTPPLRVRTRLTRGWIKPLDVIQADLAFRWSSHDLELHGLDNLRASVAHDYDKADFQEREMSAFVWLVECLDEYKELLPFLEAIPSFLETTASSSLFVQSAPPPWITYEPQKTFSVITHHRTWSLHNRLSKFIITYPTNVRAVSAFVDFYLCFNKQNWIDLRHALKSGPLRTDANVASGIYLVGGRLGGQPCPPDLRLRIYCLQGIIKSCWMSSLESYMFSFEESYSWSIKSLNLWRLLNTLKPQWNSAPTTDVYNTHLALAEVVLNVIQDLTPTNHKAFITFLDIIMDRYALHRGLGLPSCVNHPLSHNEQLLHCATISLVITMFDTEYRSEVPDDMAERLCKLFHPLLHMSTGTSLRVVNDLLQKSIWTRHHLWEYEFLFIVRAFRDKLDEEGQSYLSPQVIAKYQILRKFVLYEQSSFLTLPSADFDITALSGNTLLQEIFLQKSRILLSRPRNSSMDPETGIEEFVLFFETVLQIFYVFDDHHTLEQALQVVDTFLEFYPYNDHASECRNFLEKRIEEGKYGDRGVQVSMKPEQGIQVDLR